MDGKNVKANEPTGSGRMKGYPDVTETRDMLKTIIKDQSVSRRTSSYNNRIIDPEASVIRADDISLMSRTGALVNPVTDYNGNNMNGNRSIMEFGWLETIFGLPPLSDNIVDPPPIATKDELSGGLNSFGSGRVGYEYMNRVMERGQFLVLMPLELRPHLRDVLTNAMDGVTGGIINTARRSIANTLDTIEGRLSVTSYGYTAHVAGKRYWRSVRAHLRAILYSLGVDGNGSDNKLFEEMKKFFPEDLIESIYHQGEAQALSSILNSNVDGSSEISEFDRAMQDKSIDEYLSGDTESAGSKFGKFKDSLSTGILSKLGGVFDYFDKSSNANSAEDMTDGNGNTIAVRALHKQGFSHIMKIIANIDDTDTIIKTLPMSVFYCNGPIDRNMNFSIDANVSAIAKNTILGTKTALQGAAINGATSLVAGGVAKAIGDDNNTGNISDGSEYDSAIQEMAQEWSYHNHGSALGSFIINNIHIPKVQTGGSTDFSWTVTIKSVTVSSDRFSVARVLFPVAMLMPYVIQTARRGRALIIPSNALYCAAFSKGVINAPRAYISSMTLKTDPSFQTTYGAPTEVDITLTINPLYTVATMPDFNQFWDYSNSDVHLISAMFNPMSSLNILSTLCGQNTVFVKYPKGLIETIIQGRLYTLNQIFKGTYGSMRSSIRDYRASFKLNAKGSMIK